MSAFNQDDDSHHTNDSCNEDERERSRDLDGYKRRINECSKEMIAVEMQLNVSLTASHSQGSVRMQPAGMGTYALSARL